MKLGEALTRKADLAREIAEARTLATANLTYQVDAEGNRVSNPLDDEDVSVDGAAQLARMDQKQQELLELIQAINRTNTRACLTYDGQSMTLSEAVALRKHLIAMQSNYQTLAGGSAYSPYRYGQRLSKVDKMKQAKDLGITVEELDKQLEQTKTILTKAEATKRANQYAAQARNLDIAIQAANWQTDLQNGV